MGLRSVIAVGALGIGAIVAGADTLAPPPVTPWGTEAVEFFNARAEAFCEHDIYSVSKFYETAAVADYRALTLGSFEGQLREGRSGITSFLDACLFGEHSQFAVTVDSVFLGPNGAAVIERWSGIGYEDDHLAALVTIGPQGISTIRYFAPITIPIHGSLWLSPDEVFGFQEPEGPLTEILVTRTADGGRCPLRSAVTLEFGSGHLTPTDRFVEVESARLCLSPDELGDGWWTERPVPTELETHPNANLIIGGTTVNLHNANPSREALVRWAFDRFSVAELAQPVVDSVVFEPSRQCRGLAGLADLNDNARRIFVCIDNVDCQFSQFSACTTFANSARLSILHELAHVWIASNVSEDAKRDFMVLVGVSTWRAQSSEWSDRGVEWAAEFLTWGVMDRPSSLFRLQYPSCEVRELGFRLLTGSSPLVSCVPLN